MYWEAIGDWGVHDVPAFVRRGMQAIAPEVNERARLTIWGRWLARLVSKLAFVQA